MDGQRDDAAIAAQSSPADESTERVSGMMNDDGRPSLADWRCRRCNEKIAFDADRCPECGARQGFTALDEKVVVAIAGVGAVFFMIAIFGLMTLPYAIVSGKYEPGSELFFVVFFVIPGLAWAAIYLHRNGTP